MSARRDEWVSLPTAWIEAGGLKKFKWASAGGHRVAALMVLMVIAHHADQDDGVAKVTYDALGDATGLSRVVISAALTLLIKRGLIRRPEGGGQSALQLVDFDRTVAGWGKLPFRGLYAGRTIPGFSAFRLRSIVELDALKIYLLFVARRNNKTNYVNITYDGIEDRTGIARERIRSALTLLAACNMVHIDHVKSTTNDYGLANAYRLVHLDPYRHMGTTGRGSEAIDFVDIFE